MQGRSLPALNQSFVSTWAENEFEIILISKMLCKDQERFKKREAGNFLACLSVSSTSIVLPRKVLFAQQPV